MNTKHTLWLAAALALLGTARAGTVQLTVTDKDGKPAADVVVLVESAAKSVALPAPVAAPVVIAQEGLRFVPFLTVVPVGSTLRFVNRDGYDHHVRSTPSGPLGATPSAIEFELRLDAAAAAASPNDDYKSPAAAKKRSGAVSADVKASKPGPIGLGCHIHASMRGQVYVSNTPWFGKTDANGSVTIEGVPDGTADVTLWHSDQLQDQAPVKLQVSAAAPAKASPQLNFVPRRRRG
jgi:plastocyanin